MHTHQQRCRAHTHKVYTCDTLGVQNTNYTKTLLIVQNTLLTEYVNKCRCCRRRGGEGGVYQVYAMLQHQTRKKHPCVPIYETLCMSGDEIETRARYKDLPR